MTTQYGRGKWFLARGCRGPQTEKGKRGRPAGKEATTWEDLPDEEQK